MATTYTLISSNVLTSSAANVTFSSIPSTYTDLVLKVSIRLSNTDVDYLNLQVNSNTSSIYSGTTIANNTGSAESVSTSGTSLYIYGGIDNSANTANTFSNLEIYIPSYTSSANKPLSTFTAKEDNAASTREYLGAEAGLVRDTNAISSIKLFTASGTGNFVSNSSFYLYGIKNS